MKFGDAKNPSSCPSFRSKFSMPEMMDTISPRTQRHDLKALSDRAATRFAFDTYRRLITMFGAPPWGSTASCSKRR